MNIYIFFYFFFFGGGVITILDYIKGLFLCILGSFLRSMYRMGHIFLVAKISNLHFFGGGEGCLKFLIFFFFGGDEREMLGPSLHMEKKFEYSPTPPPLGLSHDNH